MEQWRQVVGYEGLYEVSDMGNVRSIVRTVIRFDGVVWQLQGVSRIQFIDTHGYPSVMLSKNGIRKTYRVHRIVMDAFIPYGKKREVNHIDGNKTNNRVGNLEWVTSSENKIHASKIGLMKSKPVIAYDHKTGIAVREYQSMQEVEIDGYSKGNVCECCNGRRQRHGGLAWRYA